MLNHHTKNEIEQSWHFGDTLCCRIEQSDWPRELSKVKNLMFQPFW